MFVPLIFICNISAAHRQAVKQTVSAINDSAYVDSYVTMLESSCSLL